jgi:transposase InsO family protein
MSTDGVTARYSVDEIGDGRWLTVKLDDISSYATRLDQLGVKAFTLVTRHPEDAARASGYHVASVSQPLGGWYVTALQMN